MATVLRAPFGRLLLLVIALGLVGYAAWRILEAVADAERRGRYLKGLALRAGFLGRAAIHLGLAYTAVRLAIGQRSSSAAGGNTRRNSSPARLDESQFAVAMADSVIWIVTYPNEPRALPK